MSFDRFGHLSLLSLFMVIVHKCAMGYHKQAEREIYSHTATADAMLGLRFVAGAPIARA